MLLMGTLPQQDGTSVACTHEYDKRLVWSDEAAKIMKALMIQPYYIKLGMGKNKAWTISLH